MLRLLAFTAALCLGNTVAASINDLGADSRLVQSKVAQEQKTYSDGYLAQEPHLSHSEKGRSLLCYYQMCPRLRRVAELSISRSQGRSLFTSTSLSESSAAPRRNRKLLITDLYLNENEKTTVSQQQQQQQQQEQKLSQAVIMDHAYLFDNSTGCEPSLALSGMFHKKKLQQTFYGLAKLRESRRRRRSLANSIESTSEEQATSSVPDDDISLISPFMVAPPVDVDTGADVANSVVPQKLTDAASAGTQLSSANDTQHSHSVCHHIASGFGSGFYLMHVLGEAGEAGGAQIKLPVVHPSDPSLQKIMGAEGKPSLTARTIGLLWSHLMGDVVLPSSTSSLPAMATNKHDNSPIALNETYGWPWMYMPPEKLEEVIAARLSHQHHLSESNTGHVDVATPAADLSVYAWCSHRSEKDKVGQDNGMFPSFDDGSVTLAFVNNGAAAAIRLPPSLHIPVVPRREYFVTSSSSVYEAFTARLSFAAGSEGEIQAVTGEPEAATEKRDEQEQEPKPDAESDGVASRSLGSSQRDDVSIYTGMLGSPYLALNGFGLTHLHLDKLEAKVTGRKPHASVAMISTDDVLSGHRVTSPREGDVPGHVRVPSLSYGFIVFENARLPACSGGKSMRGRKQ